MKSILFFIKVRQQVSVSNMSHNFIKTIPLTIKNFSPDKDWCLLGDVVFEEDNSYTVAFIEDNKWYRALSGK